MSVLYTLQSFTGFNHVWLEDEERLLQRIILFLFFVFLADYIIKLLIFRVVISEA